MGRLAAIIEDQLKHLKQLNDAAADAANAGFTHALLLGMGGSSLCPEVLKITYGRQAGHPELHVLDSTDPAQIKSIENQVELAKTLCIVSSKSGSTLEQIYSSNISSIACSRRLARTKRANTSLPLLIPAPKCNK